MINLLPLLGKYWDLFIDGNDQKRIDSQTPPETRRERIILRDGLTASQAQSRINAQKDESFFKENADLIIDNSGKESLDGLVQRILNYEKE